MKSLAFCDWKKQLTKFQPHYYHLKLRRPQWIVATSFVVAPKDDFVDY